MGDSHRVAMDQMELQQKKKQYIITSIQQPAVLPMHKSSLLHKVQGETLHKQ